MFPDKSRCRFSGSWRRNRRAEQRRRRTGILGQQSIALVRRYEARSNQIDRCLRDGLGLFQVSILQKEHLVRERRGTRMGTVSMQWNTLAVRERLGPGQSFASRERRGL